MTILKKLAITTVAVTMTAKAIIITSNDEWGDLSYQVTTGLFQRSLPQDQKTKVVILGTGWAALSCLQKLDSKKVDVKIISPRSYFFYTPLLAGTATGTVCSTSIIEPIRWHLLKYGTNNFIQGECLGINFQKKSVQYSCGEIDKGKDEGGVHELPYDHLIIAVGAQPATFNIPGVEENAIFMKEVENGIIVQHKVLEILERANGLLATGESEEKIKQLLHWVIIGGGPTGVELTAELNDFIRNDVQKYFPHLLPFIHVTLLEATGKILGMFDPKISNYAQMTLTKHGASVLCNSAVVKMTENSVEIKKLTQGGTDGAGSQIEKLTYGMVVWAGGITARPITQKIAKLIGGEQVPVEGRPIRGLLVGDKFQVKGLSTREAGAEVTAGGEMTTEGGTGPCVWSIGDCALSGCPPTAQAAFQQGNYLGRMLRDTNFDSRLIAEYPSFTMTHYGAMAYLGASQGVAELKGMLWDRYPVSREPNENTIVEGTGAFALWRSLYFSRLLSNRNKAQVIFDWFKASVFGRDISSPYVLRPSPSPVPVPETSGRAKAQGKAP